MSDGSYGHSRRFYALPRMSALPPDFDRTADMPELSKSADFVAEIRITECRG
jgi:hypothetical protein